MTQSHPVLDRPTLIYAPDSPLEASLQCLTAAAKTSAPLHLYGESGTGKEVMARHAHLASPFAEGPFVAVNCGALPASLIDAELFGVVKGAFTGASADRLGRIREAQGGTLFLDEIGELPLEIQVRLLRVLQEREVRPVGGRYDVPVHFRLITATHRNLQADVLTGRFRADLRYRIEVLRIDIPPLRMRRDDIPLLLRKAFENRLAAYEIEIALLDLPLCLNQYPFPGNIRELYTLAERYLLFQALGGGWPQALAGWVTSNNDSDNLQGDSREKQIQVTSIRSFRSQSPELGRKFPMSWRASRCSDAEILSALEASGGHRARAASRLGLSRRALQYRLARGLEQASGNQ